MAGEQIMSEASVPLSRAWNSWDSDHPAAMRYLPIGLELRPCAYAASRNAFTDFPAGAPGLRLGPRSITAENVRLDLSHAGTELELRYERPEPQVLVGRYRAINYGEWGLRFWVLLVLRFMPPGANVLVPWQFDGSTGVAKAEHETQRVAVGAARRPLLVTVHESMDALRAEMQEKGYWYLEFRGSCGPVMALRFNLEEMPELSFAAAVGDDIKSATEAVRATLLAIPPSLPSPSRGEGELAQVQSPSPLRGEGWGGGERKYESSDPTLSGSRRDRLEHRMGSG